ncbi:MAG: helix-turn-helix domain-containing protein [Bacteriovoracia bacterium]
MKTKRTSQANPTLEGKILRFFRKSKSISMRQAGSLIGLSDTFINHIEHGRLDLTECRISKIIEAYGFTLEEFQQYREGKPIPVVDLKEECRSLLEKIDETKLRAVHGVLTSFVR